MTTPYDDVLGLSVDEAITILEKRGIQSIRVQMTAPPNKPDRQGVARVVAVRENGRVLIAAVFRDALAEAETPPAAALKDHFREDMP